MPARPRHGDEHRSTARGIPQGDPPFYLSYHWLRAGPGSRRRVRRDANGVRPSRLSRAQPSPCRPACAPLGQPGRYRLMWDVVQEGRLWFSTEPGATLAVSQVTVVGPAGARGIRAVGRTAAAASDGAARAAAPVASGRPDVCGAPASWRRSRQLPPAVRRLCGPHESRPAHAQQQHVPRDPRRQWCRWRPGVRLAGVVDRATACVPACAKRRPIDRSSRTSAWRSPSWRSACTVRSIPFLVSRPRTP